VSAYQWQAKPRQVACNHLFGCGTLVDDGRVYRTMMISSARAMASWWHEVTWAWRLLQRR
jgi:hypothetical protein